MCHADRCRWKLAHRHHRSAPTPPIGALILYLPRSTVPPQPPCVAQREPMMGSDRPLTAARWWACWSPSSASALSCSSERDPSRPRTGAWRALEPCAPSRLTCVTLGPFGLCRGPRLTEAQLHSRIVTAAATGKADVPLPLSAARWACAGARTARHARRRSPSNSRALEAASSRTAHVDFARGVTG